MIQMQTMLGAADNSGAKKLVCVKVLGGSKRRYASVGDIIVIIISHCCVRLVMALESCISLSL